MLLDMPVRAIGINHVAFEVADVDETLAWYERWFEFTLRGRGRRMAFIDLGDQFIALMQADADGPHLDRTRHHGIVVDDKEALRAELLDAGVEVAASGSLRIRDPSGNRIEICYRRALGHPELVEGQPQPSQLRP